ncbi:MAG: oligosaccharide flippase family protein [Clostridia bacterium]|nr:oligosaccharide flippase family protein [Clostridia bacterium]
MKNKINQLKLGSVLSYVSMLLNILVSAVYSPIMIRLLGQSEYGLYSTVSSTIATLSVLNLGFSAGYIRYFSRYKKDNDMESVYRLNALYLIIFSIIGAIAFICGLLFTLNIELIYADGFTASEYSTARVLMLLMAINMATNFAFTVFRVSLTANERFVFSRLISITLTLIKPAIMLPLLFLGHKSITMVVVTLVIGLALDLIYVLYFFIVLKYKFVFRGMDSAILKGLFAYTGFIAMHLIVDQVNFNIDKILLGRFVGTASVAVYSVGYTLFNYYMNFSTATSGVFTPRVHKIVNANADNPIEQRRELTALFTKIGRLQFLLLGLLITGLIFFGRPFIGHWAGAGYDNSYYVLLLLAVPCTVPLMQNIGIEIERALNIHKFRCVAYFIMAILNLTFSIIMCQKYGEIGVAIGTAISFVICQGFIINIHYQKRCNINIIHFWKNILSIAKGQVLPVAVGITIMQLANMSNILMMFMWIAVYTGIYCLSVWLFSMNKYERELILTPVRKVFNILLRKNEKS